MGLKFSSPLALASKKLYLVRYAAIHVLERCGIEPGCCPRPTSIASVCVAAAAPRSSRDGNASKRRASNDAAGNKGERRRTGHGRSSRDLECRFSSGSQSDGGHRRSRDRASSEKKLTSRNSLERPNLFVSQAHMFAGLLLPWCGIRAIFTLRATSRAVRDAIDGDRDFWKRVIAKMVGPSLAECCRVVPSPLVVVQVVLACSGPPSTSGCEICEMLCALGIDATRAKSLAGVADACAADPRARLSFLVKHRPSEDLVAAVTATVMHGVHISMVFRTLYRRLLPHDVDTGRELAQVVLDNYEKQNERMLHRLSQIVEPIKRSQQIPNDHADVVALYLMVCKDATPPSDLEHILVDLAGDDSRLLARFLALYSWKTVPLEGAFGMLLGRLQLPCRREDVVRIVHAFARVYICQNKENVHVRNGRSKAIENMASELMWQLPEVFSCALRRRFVTE